MTNIIDSLIYLGLLVVILYYLQYTFAQTKKLHRRAEDFEDTSRSAYYNEDTEHYLETPTTRFKKKDLENMLSPDRKPQYAMGYPDMIFDNPDLCNKQPFEYASFAKKQKPLTKWECQYPWRECNQTTMPIYWSNRESEPEPSI